MQSCCVAFPLLLLVATTWAGELRCLRPGAPVISLYKDGRYFPGNLDGLGESIDVTFQNGQQQSYSSFTNDVIVDDVPDPKELEGGSRVLARRPSSISFEPGFVNGSIKGLPLNDTYLVNFDNGDSIARNIQDIRLAVKPRSCMNEKGIYIGCFENVVNNFLTNYYPVNPTDVATCNWACFTRGFRFAGLQNGTWCFCGNHVNDTLKVDDNECNIACRDSREDVCGGYHRMTVYWTGAEYENNTDDFGDFPDSKSPLTSEDDLLKAESPTESACADLYDSTQCNTWAVQSRCIENPDWMIANCKKSCYACGYNDHREDKSDSAPPTYTSDASSHTPTQDNAYQSSAQSSSAKDSDHPVLDNKSNTPGYLGCFRDSASSHDLEYLADIRPLSIRACVTKCKSLRFPYAGAQSSSSCYCGLHYGKYGQLEHEDCNTPCEGDSSEMCGGIYKNSLYNTGFPTKFKLEKDAASNLPTKNPPTSPYSGSNTANTRPYQANPSSYYAPQYQQPAYPQQSAGYTPPVYRPPASPYTQATMPGQPGYPQTSNTPSNVNGYQPAYPYNTQASTGYSNQASNSGLPGATNAYTRDYSPADSSSYRWRETYVKLRQQEQARYSKPNLNNLRKLQKSENSQRKNHGISDHEKHKKGSSNFKAFENNERASSVSQALYVQLMSQMKKKSRGRNSGGNSNIPGKGAKPQHHKFEKPGVFLRKKASKKNSFLAFLPHEVTENESLLQNVYNMLSVMLKNLRKHKKSSLKNLKKYLNFSKSNAQNSEFSKKVSLHPGEHKESVDRAKNQAAERKVDDSTQSQTSKTRELSMRGKAQETISSHLKNMAKNNPLKGQKQLSKLEKGIPNSGGQMLTGQTMRSRSHDPQMKTYASRVNTNQSMKPSKNYGSMVNTAQQHRKDGNKLNQPSENVSRTPPQVESKPPPSSWQTQDHAMPSGVNRNVSEVISRNESQAKSGVGAEGKLEDQKVSKHVSGVQEITNSYNFPKVGSNFQHVSKQGGSFEKDSSTENAGQEKKLVKDVSPKYTKNVKETSKKEKSKTSKTKSKTKLKANSTITSSHTANDTMEGKSDEFIISTIVNMIEKEKAARNHSSEREKNDGKTGHGNTGGKRKHKRQSKSIKHEKVKKKKRNKLKHSKHKNVSDTKRIYKKDHVERAMDEQKENDDDDNLMVEDEDFHKENKIDE